MTRKAADCIPTMPQICHPHAITLFYDDYRKGIADVIEHPEKMHELVLNAGLSYGVDGIRLFRPWKPHRVTDDGTEMVAYDKQTNERVGVVDVYGGGAVRPDESALPIESEEDIALIETVRKEELLESDGTAVLKESVTKAHERGLFVASSPPGFTMNFLSDRRGRSRALIDIVDNPELSHAIMDKGLEISIQHAEALVETGIDALYIGDPSSSASLISPAHFREYCLPRFTDFCTRLHRKNVLIYMHICGNSSPILEMMADSGADCVEPLDPLGGVDIAVAKKRIGDRVALMGGLNTLVLLNGTPQQVHENALECAKKGGAAGYILAAGDMVPDFAPRENIEAMVEAAHSISHT